MQGIESDAKAESLYRNLGYIVQSPESVLADYRAQSSYGARGKFGEHERSVRVNSSFLSAL